MSSEITATPEIVPRGEVAASREIRLRAMFNWKSALFYLVHLAALWAFWLPFEPWMLALCLGLYFLRMFAITAGYHRYFSHRSFKTSRAFQLILALLGVLAVQKGPLWWAGHHRHHHRHSDEEPDLHSPTLQGFIWSHLGWFLSTQHDETPADNIQDFAGYPELRWLDRYHLLPVIALGALLFFAGGLPALVWGLFVSTVLTWHGTFFINSLAHVLGKRRYATTDNSKNSLLLALITLGEGWHNNHHHYHGCARQGFYWWEIDISYYIIRLLGVLGIVWDIREPSERVKRRNRIDRGAGGAVAAE